MRVFLSAGKKVYFTLLASSFMFPIQVFAQCVDNEDCVSLGYNKTSCKTPGLKCPFGEYYWCPKDCEDGYEWKDGACQPEEPEGAVLGQCTGYAKNCKIGQILNADGSCSDYRVSGVEPVGVVVYIGGDGCGQALALQGLGEYKWSTENVDIPDLANYSSAPTENFDSCENTKIVIDYSSKQYGDGASKYYPAFWKVYNYAPSTMPETKGKWCLPAGGVSNSINQNRAAIDLGLTRINKENIGNSRWWTSSESNSSFAWLSVMAAVVGGDQTRLYTDYKVYDFYYVRPVIEF